MAKLGRTVYKQSKQVLLVISFPIKNLDFCDIYLAVPKVFT
jgi:hypothetical protein